MNKINTYLDGILVQIPIPMAPPLRYVNSYLLRGENGYTLIDPGPRTAEAERKWEEVWDSLRIRPSEINSIVLTHHHPDHFGLSGYLQRLTGADVLMSRQGHQEALRMWEESREMNGKLPAWFLENGLPPEIVSQLPAHLESFFPQVTPMPNVSYIADSETFALGGFRWKAVETGGHASGHLSFYNGAERMILCGDAVLPQISPNISMYPGGDDRPLHTFLESLRKLDTYDVNTAFPGHRQTFDYFHDRIEALLSHHEDRLQKIYNLLEGGPLNAYEVCLALFGGKLSIHQMRFAMSESLAHLAELVRRNQAAMEDGQGAIRRFALAKLTLRS